MNDWRQLLHDHYDDPYHRGACDAPTHAGSADCEDCQCQLDFELCVDASGKVLQAWFDGAGCETCEALASLLAGYCEGLTLGELRQLNVERLGTRLGLTSEELWNAAPCTSLPLMALQATLRSPLDPLDGDLADGTSFGGPSLREEC